VCWFAFSTVPVFTYGTGDHPAVGNFLQSHPGDYRFIKTDFNNLAMKWHAQDMGGYESLRLRRYDEFIQWSQGKNPDEVPNLVVIKKIHPAFRLLRLRYAFDTQSGSRQTFKTPLPHVLLVQNYRILSARNDIFKALGSNNFDSSREVILENEPNPRPQPGPAAGTATVKVLDTDTMEIEADTPRPALLLVTDTYSKGWRATALPGSTQSQYTVMPANYILRAIPLSAGKHHIRLEYLPWSFVVGKWISLASLGIYLLSAALYWRSRSRRR
jgi:hypothetical protein